MYKSEIEFIQQIDQWSHDAMQCCKLRRKFAMLIYSLRYIHVTKTHEYDLRIYQS